MDTGMGRIGFLPNEKSIDDITEIYSLEGIDVVGIFTHFSTSDEKDKEYAVVKREKLVFPKFDKNDIRIEKFPYGAHYYAYVGDVQVKDGTTLKWNTYEEARRQAEKYVRN